MAIFLKVVGGMSARDNSGSNAIMHRGDGVGKAMLNLSRHIASGVT
jgi:hypothetical protein